MAITMRISLLILSFATSILGHGHVDEIWAPNPTKHYWGWNPNSFDTQPYPNTTPGWYTDNKGGGPITPPWGGLQGTNIICGNDSAPAKISAPIAAGQTVRVRWSSTGINASTTPGDDAWPETHKGPVIDYIAACNGPCSAVKATDLKFVKFAQQGWIDSHETFGFWAADKLREDNSSWNITIPQHLYPGEYVIRHEIIALHVADNKADGAQFYPQCVSVKVSGTGTVKITGGGDPRTFYTANDPGVYYTTLHQGDTHSDYIIPGPALWTGAKKRRSFQA